MKRKNIEPLQLRQHFQEKAFRCKATVQSVKALTLTLMWPIPSKVVIPILP